jgi:hypothetical protein
MREMFLDRADWVLSGALDSWGDPIAPYFDLVIFLSTPTAVRLQRLRAREATHFGAAAVAPGGWHHQETEEFIVWASHYEVGDREGRNLQRHQNWLAGLSCPVLRLDGDRPVPDQIEEIRAFLSR